MLYINKLTKISNQIKALSQSTNLVVVTKNQDQNIINELVETNHINFGENRVQEAINKWSNIINFKKNIKLHLIGKIQSNKVKQAFNIFDYIHSLDSLKIAEIFSKLEMNGKKKIKYFIQVNLAKESQKGGVYEEYLVEFLNICKKKLNLDILGLMCIPPISDNPDKYFKKLKELKEQNNLTELSMGMSSDYELAIKYGSTYVRIGSAIFSNQS
jgi:pyridoxal phosphate enzyme (YggS family)